MIWWDFNQVERELPANHCGCLIARISLFNSDSALFSSKDSDRRLKPFCFWDTCRPWWLCTPLVAEHQYSRHRRGRGSMAAYTHHSCKHLAGTEQTFSWKAGTLPQGLDWMKIIVTSSISDNELAELRTRLFKHSGHVNTQEAQSHWEVNCELWMPVASYLMEPDSF